MNDRDIFLKAIELDHLETRSAFVAEACRGDQILFENVQELLRFHDESGGLFEEPSLAVFGDEWTEAANPTDVGEPTTAHAAAHPPAEVKQTELADLDSTRLYRSPDDVEEQTKMVPDPVGRRRSTLEVGTIFADRYQLIEVIGEGGMGTVYRANQTKPVKRQVALKLIKVGMDSKTVLARFDAERQALAMMDHPNIAHVYDGGTTADGLPYFVMEFVQGISITEYCDKRRLTVKARLELFILVCRAIQHAHQKGIIHRDLKPGNVLVGEIDGQATPKVIDFGVAKAIEVNLTEKTIDDLGAIVGTPSYMSPEQADPTSMDIDTRTDVYSLGVLLYELLAGSPPIGDKKFPRGAVLEMLRMVREVEPPRPSTRVSTADELPSIAANRSVDPSRLPRLLQGDLDWILLKSIEKDRTRRYETANDLAADLMRHLAHEPVVARPPSASYRLQKAWQRNRLAFITAGIVIATLIAGISVSTFAALDAIAARESESDQKMKAIRARDGESEQKQIAIAAEQRAANEASDNLRLANEAEAARQAAQTIVADMQTQRGLLAAGEGDSAAAMLWFANAATQTPHDPQRESANRLRAQNAMNDSFLPAAAMRFPDGKRRKRLEFQPQGELLLTSSQGDAQIWNWELEQSLPWADELPDPGDMCWSPDGRHVAVGFATGELQIRAVPSGDIVRRFNVGEPILAIEYAPGGRRLASAGRTVRLWKLDGDPVVEREWVHSAPVHSLAFNRGGTRLATACHDEHVRLFSLTNDQTDPLFPPVKHVMHQEAPPVFADNDRRMITVVDNNRLAWWDTETGADVTPTSATTRVGRIFCLTSSLDGRFVAVGADRNAMVFGLDGQQTIFPYHHSANWVAFSPDSSLLATGCDDFAVLLWNREKNDRPIATVPHMEALSQVAFSASGNLLATCGWNRLRLWKRSTLDAVVNYLSWSPPYWKPRVAFDGRWVTPGSWHEGPININEVLTSLSVKELQSGGSAGPTITINAMTDSCLCGDNRSVAATSFEASSGQLSVFDVASGRKTIPSISLPSKPVSVAARPNNGDVAVLCQNNQIVVFNSDDGSPRHNFSASTTNRFDRSQRLTYSPDGTALVVLSSMNEIHVHEAETAELRYSPIRPLLEGSMTCRVITISLDSRWLATGVTGRNALQVWDLQTGEPASEPMLEPGDFYGIFAVAFSPDGRWLLSGNKDGRARLWDWRTGQLVCPAMEHGDEVLDVAFTPDGRHALTSERMGSVQLWELTTGKRVSAPVRFPKVPNPWTNTVTVIGDRAIAGCSDYPLIDLNALLTEPKLPNQSLIALAELATARRLQLGQLNGISESEWLDAWNRVRSNELSPQQRAKDLASQLDRATDSTSLRMIAERAANSENVLSQLLQLRPDVPQLHVAMARRDKQKSDPRTAGHRARAIELYEQQVTELDEGAMKQLAELLFDSLESNWRPLDIRESHSRDGATMNRREDGAILVTGKHSLGDVYTLTAVGGVDQVKALRLEVLPDPSLPYKGPGRHESGNFQLAAFRLFRPAAQGEERQPVAVADAWASYTYPAPPINILGTIHEERHQVWHVFGRPGQPHHAIFVPTDPVQVDGNHPLIIELRHHALEPAINLGCFRLLATGDSRAFQLEQDRMAFQRDRFSTPYQLASAYLFTGNLERSLLILQKASESPVSAEQGVRLFLQAAIYERLNQPQAALPYYEQLREWMKTNSFGEHLQRRAIDKLKSLKRQ